MFSRNKFFSAVFTAAAALLSITACGGGHDAGSIVGPFPKPDSTTYRATVPTSGLSIGSTLIGGLQNAIGTPIAMFESPSEVVITTQKECAVYSKTMAVPQLVKTLPMPSPLPMGRTRCAVSPDGKSYLIPFRDNEVEVANGSGVLIGYLPTDDPAHALSFYLFTSDSTVMTADYQKHVYMWKFASNGIPLSAPVPLVEYTDNSRYVSDAVVANGIIFTKFSDGCYDGRRIGDYQTVFISQACHTFSSNLAHSEMAVSPDGKYLYSTDENETWRATIDEGGLINSINTTLTSLGGVGDYVRSLSIDGSDVKMAMGQGGLYVTDLDFSNQKSIQVDPTKGPIYAAPSVGPNLDQLSAITVDRWVTINQK